MNLTFYLKRILLLLLYCLIPQDFLPAQPAGQAAPPTVGPESSLTITAPKSDVGDGHTATFPAMGTLVELTVYHGDRLRVEAAFREAQTLVVELAAVLTDYDANSEARRLTELAVGQPAHVSDTLWEMLAAADSWNRNSKGALDCSLGRLTQLWRRYRRAGRVPTEHEVQQALERCGWKYIDLDADRRTATIAFSDMRLDFGAIGKGYIVDRVFDLLQHHELSCCLVNISGNMRCGEPPSGRAGWRIAVSGLSPEGQPLRRIEVRDIAIATSGDLWQFVTVDGQRRSHILDPRTGYGVPGPLAVTVLAPSALAADALATIGCIADWQDFKRLLSKYEGTAALRASQYAELEVIATESFPRSQ
ncbi:MAG: FAD:protein FMN transferase [Pirellulaceae bacterium]|nr:FAD:protein FMN transferase [Pirellulaceae bacterium]